MKLTILLIGMWIASFFCSYVLGASLFSFIMMENHFNVTEWADFARFFLVGFSFIPPASFLVYFKKD